MRGWFPAASGIASRFAAELRSGLKATVDDLREELSRSQGNLDRLTDAWVTVGAHLDVLLRPRSLHSLTDVSPVRLGCAGAACYWLAAACCGRARGAAKPQCQAPARGRRPRRTHTR